MQESYTAINGVMEDSVLLEYATMHGYGKTKLKAMLKEWNRVMELINIYGREDIEKEDATKALGDGVDDLYRDYLRHLELSRTRFKRAPEVLEKLGAFGARKRTQTGIMDEIRLFYDTALHDEAARSGLDDIQICKDELQTEYDAIMHLFELKQQQEKEEADVQRARVIRDEALEALEDDVNDMKSYVTIEAEYNGEEHRLEKAGIRVRS